MRCPRCSERDTRVVDSRGAPSGDAIRRRRQCGSCGFRFTTYERVEGSLPFVVKKGGRREVFDRAKVLKGVERACEKRPVSVERLESLVAEVEREVVERGDKEIGSSHIGEAVMSRLRVLDEVAYVRFASVYRSFKDIDEFMSELGTLLRQRGGPGDGDEEP
jgi:transcriptional repressor NrdR